VAPRGYHAAAVGRALLASICLAAGFALLAGAASASDLVDRNATGVRLAVSRGGMALLTYRAAGRTRHVLVWGAVNARSPSRTEPQVRFRIDYTGGWETHRREIWRTLKNACRPYRGPRLAWFVTGCTAADGSFWALQTWERLLPHRGVAPWLPAQAAFELRISHWRGPIAQLQGYTDWVFGGEAHDLFGRYTYLGEPVHGFRRTDGYTRNLYIDTLDSRYGAGWKRETSVVSRNPNGNYCYSFYPTRDPSLPGAPLRPPGNGSRYRITAIGPGVTPDVLWEGEGLPDFDARNPGLVAHEERMNQLVDLIAAGDPLCLHH
jgi:hypothetical protein